jgi:hypothetical protein
VLSELCWFDKIFLVLIQGAEGTMKRLVRILSGLSMLVGGIALAPTAAMADCATVAGNLVANCGFEDGVYASSPSTIDGNINSSVPKQWTPNDAFDAGYFYEGPVMVPHSGTYALQIANDDGNPVPALSQQISDTSGQTYKETFWLSYGGYGTTDTLPFFDAQINGANKLTFNYQTPSTYTAYSFDFVGSGTDVLTFRGNTTPSYWYLDDVSVVAVPEPSAAWMLMFGLGGLGALAHRRLRMA